MERKFTSYFIEDFLVFKIQMLNFGKKFSIFCFLDNHGYEFNKSYDCIAGAGVSAVSHELSAVSSELSAMSHQLSAMSNEPSAISLEPSAISLEPSAIGKRNSLNAHWSQLKADSSQLTAHNSLLKKLDQFRNKNQDWIFGHIAYDVKNEIEDLQSSNPDGIRFPDIHFFVPEIVFILKKNEVQIGAAGAYDAQKIYDEIVSGSPAEVLACKMPSLKSRFHRNEYIDTVKKLQEHIARGDCYEMNFCQEFYADDTVIDPHDVFQKLSTFSPNPFSAFYQYEDKYLICSSPERFLKKRENTIISQPMKGTAKRITNDAKADEQQMKDLYNNEKERSENIMIVDLVRNDLAKICTEGSVYVKEFLKIYAFPQVHQMISTIQGNLKENISLSEIFSATFPMGSMTGAPKKRVMELIEKYERTKRGLFSGTVGYINPDGDFDFNVVIRSVLYNKSNKYVSIQAGSAITFKSIPENEYEECLLKVSAIKKALE
ncbi:MAG: anthranilate synthase component I family protein [Ginsengibacter sp.]